jgi:oligopeptide transport system ATP-binding protein
MALLNVENLKVSFHTRNGVVRAVNDVSFAIDQGETLGIVGESGSGKSVTCYSILRLIAQPPGRIENGSVRFGDIDLLQAGEAELRRIRGKQISMVFQDPMTCLNPYLRVEDQLIEPLIIHERMKRADAVRRAIELLEEVGVPDAARRIRNHPHEFSGGMRQRVMIAIALITRPKLLIADEPTTALDVTVQAQILELVRRLQHDFGMSVMWITHDLGVVAGLCQRVLVMYAGRIVESAPTTDLYSRPLHPYTQALQRSIPALQSKGSELYTIPGSPPDLSKEMAGCPFAPRCKFAVEHCLQPIQLKAIGSNRATACVRVQNGEITL